MEVDFVQESSALVNGAQPLHLCTHISNVKEERGNKKEERRQEINDGGGKDGRTKNAGEILVFIFSLSFCSSPIYLFGSTYHLIRPSA